MDNFKLAMQAAGEHGSRLDSREYNWFVLCVPPQRELVAEHILRDAGFAVFVPTKVEFKFANKIARCKGVKTERILPIMPRYVFIGMNEHTPGWAGVFRFEIVTSLIWFDGKPYEVPHDPLRRFMWRHSAGEFSAPDHHRYMQTHREFEEGADVISDLGIEGKVTKITGNMAKVLIELLGGKHEVDIALEKLTPVQYCCG